MNKNIVFTTKIGDKEVELMVRRPNMPHQREGQKVYNAAFADALKSKAILRSKLDDFMRDQGLWDDAKQAELMKLGNQVATLEKALLAGGIKLKDAFKKAIELKKVRAKINDLVSERTRQDIHTADGQADNAQFNYLVSACTVYNDTQKPVFKDMDDYIEKSTEEYAVEAASKLAKLLYGLSEDYESNLEENKFLREYKFSDDKNRLVNKEGQLVDVDGNRIDEEGYLLDVNGNRVDKDGVPLDSDGKYIIERKPFLDDDENEILLSVQPSPVGAE